MRTFHEGQKRDLHIAVGPGTRRLRPLSSSDCGKAFNNRRGDFKRGEPDGAALARGVRGKLVSCSSQDTLDRGP